MIIVCSACSSEKPDVPVFKNNEEIVITKSVLKDKIMGGWAGQVIGCTYGGPTEFRFKGTMVPDDHFIQWYDGVIKWWYENAPGLYDDVYMDLTFVDVFEKEGLDAPVESFAKAFAYAEYNLWHANQAARYNILNGIMPPSSGNWINNPHADDIDFQIEADFAGIMSPGMVNTATGLSDGIGHIMNYGDGWYGGVYVAAMYALAYISNDVEFVVKEGLRAIPENSSFYKLMSDVIHWYEEYPDNWKMTWFRTQEKWASEVGCPDGVYADFNIDAKINSAYIIIGLLYGKGDFGESVRISTLCGQDSDCNPASAAGILGVMKGYSNIPDEWKLGLTEVEDMEFKYTDISLNDAYAYSFRQAMEIIERNSGTSSGNDVMIKYQEPVSVRFEEGFTGHFPAEYRDIYQKLSAEKTNLSFQFEGVGFVVNGESKNEKDYEYIANIEVHIDGKLHEKAGLPVKFATRRHEVTWAYNLEPGKHIVEIRLLNPAPSAEVRANKVIVYSNKKEKRVRPGIEVINNE